MKYLLNLTYDGSKFYGFQKQNRWETVEGNLESTISKMLNRNINIVGCSRTDRGVHAINSYAHFIAPEIKDTKKFVYSLNKLISNSIYVKCIYKVDDDFSARYRAKMKEYVYKINTGAYNPIEKDYIYQYNKNIDMSLLKKACKKLKGKHNFKSFTSDNEKNSYEREVNSIRIVKNKDYVYIYFKAKGFLRYMVRNMVGLLLELNDGKRNIEDIKTIFEAEDRNANAKIADPCGLYLNNVWFRR